MVHRHTAQTTFDYRSKQDEKMASRYLAWEECDYYEVQILNQETAYSDAHDEGAPITIRQLNEVFD